MNDLKQPKKLLILYILDILRRYSDEEHALTQKQIGDILAREYSMKVNRKAVKANLLDLLDFGYEIEYSEVPRKSKTGEIESLCTDFRLVHDFSPEELMLLSDAVLFSLSIPSSHRKELLNKIKKLGSEYYPGKAGAVRAVSGDAENRQFFYTLGVIREALSKRLKVRFHYARYGADKRLHKKERRGAPVEYLVDPQNTCIKNGRYYLIGNAEGIEDIFHFRIERICDIALTSLPAEPAEKSGAFSDPSNVLEYTSEHLYMFGGESVSAILRVDEDIISDVVDWFGKDVTFFNKTEKGADARVVANATSIKYWALQYCRGAEVLEPLFLRKAVSDALFDGLSKYTPEVRTSASGA